MKYLNLQGELKGGSHYLKPFMVLPCISRPVIGQTKQYSHGDNSPCVRISFRRDSSTVSCCKAHI